MLLRALYSVRSEIQLCEQINYNLLFRWFLDMQPSDKVWTPEVFSTDRTRFARHGFVRRSFEKVVSEATLGVLVSEEHFRVDGSLIQSYASLKSLRLINGPGPTVSDGGEDDDPVIWPTTSRARSVPMLPIAASLTRKRAWPARVKASPPCSAIARIC